MNRLRRQVLAFAVAAACLPAAAAPRRRRLACMHFGSPKDWKAWLDLFLKALEEQGLVQDRDFELLLAGLEAGDYESAVKEARAKVDSLRADVIVTDGPVMTHLITLATRSVPLVTQVPNPVDSGYAKTLSRPGGNVTGLSDNVEETSVKSMELLRQLVPKAARVAIFSEARPASKRHAARYAHAARAAGLEPVMVQSNAVEELLNAIGSLRARGIQAGFWTAFRFLRQAAQKALAERVPMLGDAQIWVKYGGLASYYGHEPNPEARLAAVTAQVLRGTDPGAIPFQLPQFFRVAINRKTAVAVGVAVPAELLLRADEVID
jgi:putative ABC transport system substrate-binding protein